MQMTHFVAPQTFENRDSNTINSQLFGTLFNNHKFHGFRVAHVSQKSLRLNQQDLQLGLYFVKWQLVVDRDCPDILLIILLIISIYINYKYSGPNSWGSINLQEFTQTYTLQHLCHLRLQQNLIF